MLRNFTVALIATALIAGSAFAAQPSNVAGAAPAATAAAPANTKGQATPKAIDAGKPVKHARTHVRHHVAHVAKHLANKPGKVSKSVKSSA
jgi:hypothetical protein